MDKPPLSREILLPRLAAHVLTHGLAGASLRPLAKAAGTSDRMLIYHFGSKERLIEDLLTYVAQVYAGALDAAFGHEPARSRKDCAERILRQAANPAMAPFLALWWDIVAGSVRGKPAYRAAAAAMMEQLLAWLEAHMPPGDPDPAGGARHLLTMIEGALMLRAVGLDEISERGLAAARF